jgi:DNA repair exonuclease SbcCD nuclease subunit
MHLADLHLGKYAYGHHERFLDMMRAFAYAAKYAVGEKVDFILASGDIFDARTINSETLSQAVRIFDTLKEAGTAVFAIEGNHDRAFVRDRDSWLRFLEGRGYLRLLKPEISDRDVLFAEYGEGGGCVAHAAGVRLIGLGYPGASCSAYLEKLDGWLKKSDEYTVLLLHAGFSNMFTEDMGRTDMELLKKLLDRVDYVAMGHIHRREELMEKVFMPGSTEYTDAREAMRRDEKGFYMVDTAAGGATFVEIPVRPFVFIDVDAREKTDVLGAITAKAGKTKGAPVLAVTLKMNGPLADKKEMEERIAEEAGALLCEITVVTEAGGADAGETGTLDREAFERAVLFDLLSEKGIREERAAKLAAFAMELKKNAGNFDAEMALAGLLEVSRNDD